jgi:hypothetical protein
MHGAGEKRAVRGALGELENLLDEKGVLDEAGARHVQVGPEVQLPTEGRLEAALKKVAEIFVGVAAVVQKSFVLKKERDMRLYYWSVL